MLGPTSCQVVIEGGGPGYGYGYAGAEQPLYVEERPYYPPQVLHRQAWRWQGLLLWVFDTWAHGGSQCWCSLPVYV